MKVLAFAASNSSKSINKALVTYASQFLEGAEVEIIDIHDYEMPIFSEDRQAESGIPQLAHDFFNKIGEADALLISLAEHNGGYTAAYKNLYDWASRINMQVYQNKPTVFLAASPGGGGAASVLATAKGSAPFFGSDIKAEMSIRSFNEVFDMEKKEMANEKIKEKLKTAVQSLL